METKYLESRQARWAMYLASYNFQIIFRKGTAHPADRPSRRPDYVEGPADVTWLPTFHNKLKGSFATAIQRVSDPVEESSLNQDLVVSAIHAVYSQDVGTQQTPQDELIDHRESSLEK